MIFQDKSEKTFFIGVFLTSLKDISNEEKQKAAWINGNYEKYNIFTEITERFTSPCKYVMEWPDIPLSMRKDLSELYNRLINYKDFHEKNGERVPKTDKEIAQDPEWHKIRSFAKKVYNEFSVFSS